MAPALVPLVLCACVILYGEKPDYYESVMLCGNTLHDHSGCNINTRNIGRLLLISIPIHPTTVKVRSLHFDVYFFEFLSV